MRSLLRCAVVALCWLSVAAQADSAYDTAEPLPAPQETRYRALIQELRCLVCQNESLADSDAPLATDLRRQVRGMIAADKSNTEIRKYLTDRYGDFVLYKPPFQPNTWLLWGGPLLLVGAGLWGLGGYLRRNRARAAPVVLDEAALRRVLDQPEAEGPPAAQPTATPRKGRNA